MAIQMYANSNRGQYPPNLDAVIPGSGLTTDAFNCPSTMDTPAPAGTPLNAGGHLSYVYIPGFTFRSPSNAVIVYEPLTNHRKDGINVGFVDGHVEFVGKNKAPALIAALQAGQNPPPPNLLGP
jgi:prepilin-type processing-associated H-X9-DG protein